ncbi:MAG: sugar transport protein, partial [Frankiales bacterium]|nr:sugar transport protein [Frankiales bacterium]
APRLGEAGSGIHITTSQVTGLGAALYVTGACVGALLFGWLTDRFGRRRLFMLTLGVYLTATALTATSVNAEMFFAFRFLTGLGIGGEYAAINSAIDELIPSKYRGRVDIVINGTYWLGAAFGALLSIPALNESIFPANVGWRLTFGLGVILGLGVLIVRRNVPESPRWLFIHGHNDEAEQLVSDIEAQVERSTGVELSEVGEDDEMEIKQRRSIGFVTIARTVFSRYPKRTVLGFSLFIGQAFLYNAITFSFASILTTFFKVGTGSTGYYFAVVAIGNFAGPLLLGRLFDTLGRRVMISSTYLTSGVLLLITAWLFDGGHLSATTMTACWTVVLFFASAGASSAYLTVSEIFPMETRALAIAFFYALGTAAGGITGPLLFAKLIATGHLADTALAFLIGAIVMLLAGVVAVFLSVDAEQRSLEDIAQPLSAEEAEHHR